MGWPEISGANRLQSLKTMEATNDSIAVGRVRAFEIELIEPPVLDEFEVSGSKGSADQEFQELAQSRVTVLETPEINMIPNSEVIEVRPSTIRTTTGVELSHTIQSGSSSTQEGLVRFSRNFQVQEQQSKAAVLFNQSDPAVFGSAPNRKISNVPGQESTRGIMATLGSVPSKIHKVNSITANSSGSQIADQVSRSEIELSRMNVTLPQSELTTPEAGMPPKATSSTGKGIVTQLDVSQGERELSYISKYQNIRTTDAAIHVHGASSRPMMFAALHSGRHTSSAEITKTNTKQVDSRNNFKTNHVFSKHSRVDAEQRGPLAGQLHSVLESTEPVVSINPEQRTSTNSIIGTSSPLGIASPAPAPISHQILVQLMREGQSGQAQEFEIQIDPEELGKVRIIVSPKESGLIISFTAERQETLDLLRRHSADLLDGLNDSNFGETSLSFNLGGENNSGSSDTNSSSENLYSNADQNLPASIAISIENDRLDVRL